MYDGLQMKWLTSPSVPPYMYRKRHKSIAKPRTIAPGNVYVVYVDFSLLVIASSRTVVRVSGPLDLQQAGC